MKTSYFGNIKKLQAEGCTNLVAISQGIPRWNVKQVRDFKALAPSWDLVHEKNEDVYTERYINEVLSKLDAKTIYNQLGEDAVLLCWEKPGEFCHRLIVAEWFERELGIKVSEFVPKDVKKLGQQLNLF